MENNWAKLLGQELSFGKPQSDKTEQGSNWASMLKPTDVIDTEGVAREEGLTWINALKSAAINSPASAYEYGKNIYEALSHPVQTAKTLGKALIGSAQKVDPKYLKYTQEVRGLGDYRPYYQAIEDDLKSRYGNIDNFKKTFSEDPISVLADASSIIIPIGKATGIGVVAKIGARMEPISLAGKLIGLPFKLIPEKIPIDMYQSAVKFGTTLGATERNSVTKTALQAAHQIMPTMKGMQKLRGLIDGYNDKVNNLINQSVKKGERIPINEIFSGIENVKDGFKIMSDQPLVWDKAFKRILGEWKEAFKSGEFRTPEQIQRLKTGIYTDLKSLYEQYKSSPPTAKLRKSIAKNAREQLEIIIPEIKQLNKEEGALIELWDAVESKANRITNRDFISIGLPIKMGAGSGIGYMFAGEQGAAVGGVLGFALGIYDTPQVKSKIALVLNRLREQGIKLNPTRAAIRLGLYETEKITEPTKRITGG
ncbi:MAG: hypothetical protein ABIF11_10600 [Nitrospirota bacterium]